MPCLPCRGLLCHLPGRRAGKASLPQAAAVVQTAPLVTAAVPAAANAAASSLLDLVFSTLPVPPPFPKILLLSLVNFAAVSECYHPETISR